MLPADIDANMLQGEEGDNIYKQRGSMGFDRNTRFLRFVGAVYNMLVGFMAFNYSKIANLGLRMDCNRFCVDFGTFLL